MILLVIPKTHPIDASISLKSQEPDTGFNVIPQLGLSPISIHKQNMIFQFPEKFTPNTQLISRPTTPSIPLTCKRRPDHCEDTSSATPREIVFK
jgi:hypothetical protein